MTTYKWHCSCANELQEFRERPLPLAAVSATSAVAADALEQQQLVNKAEMTIEAFAADPSVGPATREMKDEGRALFIVPQFLRGAFVFGGAGGSGVLLVRDEKTKK